MEQKRGRVYPEWVLTATTVQYIAVLFNYKFGLPEA